GQKEEAQKQFLEALKRATEPAQISQILYNLGTVCQSLGDQEQAMDYFKRCVENDTKHLYARLRLGQLYEQLGKRDLARRMYEEGAEIEEGAYSSNFARLHLARIAAKQEDSSEARTILQDALQHNPNDAAALLMLAKIYLEGGEDPEIAESLARKSLSLQERPEGWQVLALALRSQGQEERATQAEARALATGRAI
ncbi:MAG: tetratricopeptide repeat protein, partial [Desulfovibrio sp.]|nr:tetratricopeptide repeat protein [Desulfovibrio sp.]